MQYGTDWIEGFDCGFLHGIIFRVYTRENAFVWAGFGRVNFIYSPDGI